MTGKRRADETGQRYALPSAPASVYQYAHSINTPCKGNRAQRASAEGSPPPGAPSILTIDTAMYTFAGKMATSNAIVAHAAYGRVRGTNSPIPTPISATPDRYTKTSGAGNAGGTIWTYSSGTTKCKTPATTYSGPITYSNGRLNRAKPTRINAEYGEEEEASSDTDTYPDSRLV